MVVYEGPSNLDGKPIVGIVTGLDGTSTNRKTGPMAHLWILVQSMKPHEAVKAGVDNSVCGDCPARGKWCYVVTHQGPRAVWQHWKDGKYESYDPEKLRGAVLRFGAYGDPAAIPLEKIRELAGLVDRYTGFTHAWRYCDPLYQSFCMASCDSTTDAREAHQRGWRTFRVSTDPGDRQLNGEVSCPASEEQGYKLNCYTCGACDGRRRPTVKSNIVIQVHGNKSKSFFDEQR